MSETRKLAAILVADVEQRATIYQTKGIGSATCATTFFEPLLAASVSLWVMTAAAQDESRPDESSKVGEVNFRRFLHGLPAQQKVQPRHRDIAFPFVVRGGGKRFQRRDQDRIPRARWVIGAWR